MVQKPDYLNAAFQNAKMLHYSLVWENYRFVKMVLTHFGCQVSGFRCQKLRFFRDDAREKWPLKGHSRQVKKLNDKISRIWLVF